MQTISVLIADQGTKQHRKQQNKLTLPIALSMLFSFFHPTHEYNFTRINKHLIL
jgi:hypothetical protein